MKQIKLIVVFLVLAACNKEEKAEKVEEFIGFTAVSSGKGAPQFYIDANTVERTNDGLVSFNMVKELPNGYAIQVAKTDCKATFQPTEGVKYSKNGTSEQKYIGETLTLPSKDNPDINMLVSIACEKILREELEKGKEKYLEDIKSSEILVLRQALNAYLKEKKSSFLVEDFAVKGLVATPKKYYENKLCLLQSQNGLGGGVWLYTISQKIPDTILSFWMFRLDSGQWVLRSVETKPLSKKDAESIITDRNINWCIVDPKYGF